MSTSHVENAAMAADVPVGAPSATSIPATCDTAFWDVLKNRAWEEGQREITQNQNLMMRPDSVLSVSCFDSSLGHLANHSDDNFPGKPDESSGGGNGFMTNTVIILPDRVLDAQDPVLTQGYLMHAALELIVLDQLMGGASPLGLVEDLSKLAPCTAKDYYIGGNFPDSLLGGRASATVSFTSAVSPSSHDGCARMNAVWQEAQCYDFAAEPDHDGFYSLADYSTGSDFRTKDVQCESPSESGGAPPDPVQLACDEKIHGGTANAFPSFDVGDIAGSNPLPTWESAHAGANADIDTYLSFLEMRDSTECSSLAPRKIGYIVIRDGKKYIDAVCPAPGCIFEPPATFSGVGSCR